MAHSRLHTFCIISVTLVSVIENKRLDACHVILRGKKNTRKSALVIQSKCEKKKTMLNILLGLYAKH